jgi:hypothetical protein
VGIGSEARQQGRGKKEQAPSERVFPGWLQPIRRAEPRQPQRRRAAEPIQCAGAVSIGRGSLLMNDRHASFGGRISVVDKRQGPTGEARIARCAIQCGASTSEKTVERKCDQRGSNLMS